MNYLQLIIWRCHTFYQYFKASKSQWRIHSPFMFEFYKNVVLKRKSEIGKKIEAKRNQYLKSSEVIEIQDFGSGYGNDNQKFRKISIAEVTRSSGRKQKSGDFLWKLIQFLQPKHVLELGGNLGFSGLYISDALQTFQGNLDSVEGDLNLFTKAQKLHREFNLPTVFYHGLFSDFLHSIEKKYDLILIDGHHESQATEQYLNRCLTLLNPNGLIIIDDIRWNPDMFNCWTKLITRSDFSLTAETFQMGFIWPDKKQAKEHFILWSNILN